MLHNCVRNQIPFRYALNDIWFASAENMYYVKLKLGKEFVMALKTYRKIALSLQDNLTKFCNTSSTTPTSDKILSNTMVAITDSTYPKTQ